TRLGRADLETERTEHTESITGLQEILGDEGKLREVIVDELGEVRETFAEPRRSSLEIDPGEFDIEDLIDDDPLVFTMTATGYVKTTPAEEFRAQGRGGRGIAGAKLKDEDTITQMIQTSAHSYLLFFSTRGRVYRLKAHEIPVASRTSRGTAIVNLLPLQEGETIQAIIDTRDYETMRYLFFATAKGRVKKTRFNAYDSSLKAGLIAIKLNDDDELVEVIPTNGVFDILLSSRFGQTIRFEESQVREMGRNAAGVIGLKFKKAGDELVACDIARDGATLLHITEQGFGKRTFVDEYPTKGRGGMGVVGIKLVDEKGPVVGTLVVDDDDEVLAVTRQGVMIRTRATDISIQGRSASGVKVISPDNDDQVASIALVSAEDDDDADKGDDA
ncbi:MAG: DNA gyrase C-terminal beta-propeller domain-containing protein, partial [Acidimicrobiaceae bacterium]